MFFAGLFLTAKIWNQPKYPLVDKLIKKMRYGCIYNMINTAFLGVKKKRINYSAQSVCLCVCAFNANTKLHLHVLGL